MIKDPLYMEITPYEILDIDPNLSSKEVQLALPRFMRKPENRPNIPKAQEAVRRLTNPEDRIAVDIINYLVPDDTFEGIERSDLQLNLEDLIAVPLIEKNDLFYDLMKTNFSEDFTEITYNRMEINELREYDNLNQYQFPLMYEW
jgi:hypothetical protein